MERSEAGRAHIGRTLADSTPAFRPRPTPSPDAPNVVMIVLDDLGFGELGCYGSSIRTPNIDALAADGLQYNNFHVTALCAPTRASLMTGRNHHAVGMGYLADLPMGFPGYTAEIPPTAATLPQLLRGAGYNTFAVGKWHLTPPSEHGASGPFDRWPLGLGFERFYGFLRGMTNQWTPHLVSDNGYIEQPASPADGYHLTEDLATQAISYIQDQQQDSPDKPFFLYLAPGAMHVPHQVPPEWIEPYVDQFDDGWEATRRRTYERQLELEVIPPDTKLTERPPWVTAWDDLTVDEQRIFARQMEVYAGFLTHTDAQIGRVLDHLNDLGLADNTMVMVLSDNGADGHGGPSGFFDLSTDNNREMMLDNLADHGGFASFNGYSWGWAWAGNTPFKLWKAYTWLGGVRVPLIIHLPASILSTGAAVRPQFAHAIDLMPTILEAAGVEAPDRFNGVAQQQIDGASFAGSFASPESAAARSTQYFEMGGSRSIYHDGWKATTDHLRESNILAGMEGSADFDQDIWSLYNLTEDFSEDQDLAAVEPTLLRKLIELWWLEAGRNQVLPLTDEIIRESAAPPAAQPTRFVVKPGGRPLTIPIVAGFDATAELDVTDDALASGVVCAQGGIHGGWACYFVEGRLTTTFSLGGAAVRIESEDQLTPGFHTIHVAYVPGDADQGVDHGEVTVSIDGILVATEMVTDDPTKLAFLSRFELLHVGSDRGFAVGGGYLPPFVFNGEIHVVSIALPESVAARSANAHLAQNALGNTPARRQQ